MRFVVNSASEACVRLGSFFHLSIRTLCDIIENTGSFTQNLTEVERAKKALIFGYHFSCSLTDVRRTTFASQACDRPRPRCGESGSQW